MKEGGEKQLDIVEAPVSECFKTFAAGWKVLCRQADSYQKNVAGETIYSVPREIFDDATDSGDLPLT